MTNGIIERPVKQLEQENEVQSCVHHWIIEPPDGPVSSGYCRKCGVEKQFQNYFPHSKWESNQTDEQATKKMLEEWGV